MTALLTAQGLLAASSRQETAKLQLELNAKVAELGSKGAEVKKLQARMPLRLLDVCCCSVLFKGK